MFEQLGNYKDSAERAEKCKKMISEYQDSIEEQKRIAERTALIKKKRKKRAAIITPISAVAIAAAVCITVFVIIPSVKYNSAMQLYENGDYAQAAQAFSELGNY